MLVCFFAAVSLALPPSLARPPLLSAPISLSFFRWVFNLCFSLLPSGPLLVSPWLTLQVPSGLGGSALLLRGVAGPLPGRVPACVAASDFAGALGLGRCVRR